MKKKLKGSISFGGHDKDFNDDPSNPYLKQLIELPFYMEDIRQVSIDKRFVFPIIFEIIGDMVVDQLWRGGIVGNNINSESQGSRFNPFQPVSYTHLTLPTILLV